MLQFFVSSKDRSQELDHDSGPFEFGREPRPGTRRCVLVNDPYVSKDHLRVEELPSGAVRVANLSKRVAVPLEDGSRIKVGEARELATPIRLTLGQTAIEIRKGGELPVDATMLCTVTPPIAAAGFRRALRA